VKNRLFFPLFVLLAASAVADEYKRNATPPTDGLVGSNYTPSYTSSPIQFWHDFRPDVVKRELETAKTNFGVNMLRVYVNTTNYFGERELFFKNLETFIGIADKAGIKPGFVFFSGDHRAMNVDTEKSVDGKIELKKVAITLDGPFEPKPGHHNGRWPECPQEHEWDEKNPEDFSKFKPYIQDIVGKYKSDKRVLFWEIHNEPPHDGERRDKLKRVAYDWAKALKPIQPILNCENREYGEGDNKFPGWGDSEHTDVISAHCYDTWWKRWIFFAEYGLKEGNQKGTMFTEAGARWKGSRRNHAAPVDVINWLENRKRAKLSQPGVMLTWELNVSNSNCRWHWVDNGWQRGKPDAEPEMPWCGLQWPDGDPVSLAEAEAIRRYATGESKADLLDTFQHGLKGWKVYNQKNTMVRHCIYLNHGAKAVRGDKNWTDYTFEAHMLYKRKWLFKDEKRNNYNDVEGQPKSAVYFRVQEAGERFDDITAYTAFHDSKVLTLGKYVDGKYKELATYDLAKNGILARQIEWSMIRIEVAGPTIKVFFNRHHGDKEKGLRISYTDNDQPLLKGAVGLGSYKIDGLFDNVVVYTKK
jgi:hypothetical protein